MCSFCRFNDIVRHVSGILKSTISNNFLDAVNLLQRLAVSAGGVLRARGNYDFIREKVNDIEEEDYRHMVNLYKPGIMRPKDITFLLAPEALITYLVDVAMVTESTVVTRCLLNCIFSLACSDSILNVLTVVCATCGKFMKYLVERLEDSDHTVATYALSCFLQLGVMQAGRDALTTTELQEFLKPLIATSANYNRPHYQRAMLITAAMARTRECRFYNATTLPHLLSEPGELENLVIMDFLGTYKIPDFSQKHNYASLSILPTDYDSALKSSQMTDIYGSMQMCDFLTHPQEEQYFYSLSWDKISAICSILEGISTSPCTATAMFSAGTVRFIAATISLAKFEIIGKEMSEKRVSLLLSGMIAAANCLTNLCCTDEVIADSPFDHLTSSERFYDERAKYNTTTLQFESLLSHDHVNADIIIRGFEASGVADALCFFLSTMSIKVHNLTPKNRNFIENAALSSANLLSAYARMLIRMNSDHPELSTLIGAGPHVSKIIISLKDNFGVSSKMTSYLQSMCQLLVSLTASNAVTQEAIHHWSLFPALASHLPGPLSALNSVSTSAHRVNMGNIPAAYFDVLTSLCKIERGKIEILNGGYLRRALDKVHVLQNELEKPDELAGWKRLISLKCPVPPASKSRIETIACLRLIEACANYHNPSAGNANNLIFSHSYDIVGVCKGIIAIDECPRTDQGYIVALSVLKTISDDYAQCSEPFKEHGILDIMWNLLRVCETLPPVVLETCLHLINNQASGPVPALVLTKLKAMDETLTRCARLVSVHSKWITEIKWKILDIECGPSSKKDQQINRHAYNEELEVTDDFSVELSVALSRASGHDRKGHSSSGLEVYGLGSTEQNSASNSINSAETELSQDPRYYGTYHVCGVSTCGSLRFPGSPGKHGRFLCLSVEDQESAMQSLPQCALPTNEEIRDLTENDKRNTLFTLEVSRLTESDPEFFRMLERNKQAAGFTEKYPRAQRPLIQTTEYVSSSPLSPILHTPTSSTFPSPSVAQNSTTFLETQLEKLTSNPGKLNDLSSMSNDKGFPCMNEKGMNAMQTLLQFR